MQSIATLKPVYSVYGGDPIMADLIQIFVKSLPQRLETLKSHAEVEDWESVARVAHQLNSRASTYGFAQLSTLAARLEITCGDFPVEDEVLAALENFADYCERVRSGPGPYAYN